MIANTSKQDRIIERKPRKKLIPWLLVIAVGVAIWFIVPAMRTWSAADRSFERAKLRIETVQTGDLINDLSVDGRIVASSYPTLYSPAPGVINLAVKAGQKVEKGTRLATIASPELKSMVAQETSVTAGLEATLSRQRIQAKTDALLNQQDIGLKKLRFEAAQRAFKRAQASFENGLINIADFEAAEDEVKISELEFTNAKANATLQKERDTFELANQASQLERQKLVLKEAQRRLAELEIRSPVDGVVGSLSVDPSDAVTANQPILTVIDLSAFEIEIEIPEVYGDKVQLGTDAQIRYENQTYAGRVMAISPEVNQSFVRGTVVFNGTPPSGLKQNQRVSARMILSSLPNVLKVKRGPFVETGGGREVFLIQGQIATRTPVQLGESSISEVHIRSGLKPGDQIIISDISRFDGVETLYLRD